jgi:hypothetical protein
MKNDQPNNKRRHSKKKRADGAANALSVVAAQIQPQLSQILAPLRAKDGTIVPTKAAFRSVEREADEPADTEKEAARRYRLAQAATILEACRAAGLSDAEICLLTGIGSR